ncbi:MULTISPECIES: AraC family transcriptional regulator [unclassified Mycobacterium]|uniref:helix-turn-helix transcriptional regulator n=1 Tax=unclassified Mycobacterium TaxID=2642494 RepID=UPI00068D34F0|nr:MULTISPECIES: AraC family transcriptional regulator [unclassified Mycobacterium]SEA03495.1 AraC-type DNA-binding protein [Mycobacterium sp. 283mftsu]
MVVGALPETFALDDRPVCWLSLGSTIYLGPPLDLGGHAKMVGALILGVSGPLTMTNGGQSACARSVFIPAQLVTEMVEVPERVAVCTFDPTATRVASCTDGMCESDEGLYTGHRNERSLIEMFTEDAFNPYGILHRLGVSTPSTSRPVDPRIALVGEQIRGDPQTTVSASEAAATVGLSPSYFLTLFAAETGTTFRRYRLWVRLIHAATAIANGKSLTQASADAGFASPSHLSDTARALLGVSTTAALATGARLLVD